MTARHPHNPKRPEPQSVVNAVANDDIDTLLRVLTVRQKRFAEEYVYDFDGKAAAIRAGYAIKHADKQGATLLKHCGIAFYIDHLSRRKETNITIVDENWIVQKIITMIDKAENIVNLTAALRGLELLARHKGMLTDKQEITGKDGGAIQIAEQIKKEADEFTDLIRDLKERKKTPLSLVVNK